MRPSAGLRLIAHWFIIRHYCNTFGTITCNLGGMIMTNFNEFMRTVFVIYCIYALNCCLVVFKRPNNPGEIFGSFRIPVVVFIYFLVPCLALYLIYKAFWGIHAGTFWSGVGLVFPLSFFIMLYFLQDPNWPRSEEHTSELQSPDHL